MPRLAKTVPMTQPRLNLVYSQEDFTSVPLPDRVADYPELRYMGSKHRLLLWIHWRPSLPPLRHGGGSVLSAAAALPTFSKPWANASLLPTS